MGNTVVPHGTLLPFVEFPPIFGVPRLTAIVFYGGTTTLHNTFHR